MFIFYVGIVKKFMRVSLSVAYSFNLLKKNMINVKFLCLVKYISGNISQAYNNYKF
jgi:hypothetical protein